MFNAIVRLGLAAFLLAVAACASRYGDRPLDVSTDVLAPLRGNATVRAVVFEATPPSELVAKAKAAAVAEVVEGAAVPARDRAKRKSTRARPLAAAPSRAEPRRAAANAPRPSLTAVPSQRYQYTVEFDAGGFQTLTSFQNQGLNVYDRVQVEGKSLTALRE